MNGNTQKKIGKVRPPRVQITYDVETGGAVTQKTLPFVVGVLADLAPGGEQSKLKMGDRNFINMTSESMDKVMESLGPKIEITVPNKLGGDDSLNLNLKFNKLKDFHPEELVKNIPELEKILIARGKLNDLLAKLEGNEKLNDMLAELVFNTEVNEKAVREQKKSTSDIKETSEQEKI